MVGKIQPYNDKIQQDLTCELGIVEQNSLTPNSRICVALEP